MNSRSNFRSSCAISCGLDILGDRWSLLIIRDMLFDDKKTFKEFSNSPERIATNILSNRLTLLEEKGIITKGKLPGNKKSNVYRLTERGIDLLPIMVELAQWSNKYKDCLNIPLASKDIEMATSVCQKKANYLENMRAKLLENLKASGAVLEHISK